MDEPPEDLTEPIDVPLDGGGGGGEGPSPIYQETYGQMSLKAAQQLGVGIDRI